MPPNNKLTHGEKAFSLWSTEKGRDRANARRAIEGLDHGRQQIELLHELNASISHQNAVLVDIATMLFEIRGQLQQPAPQAQQSLPPARPPAPPQGLPPGPQPQARPVHQPSAPYPHGQPSAPYPQGQPSAPPPLMPGRPHPS